MSFVREIIILKKTYRLRNLGGINLALNGTCPVSNGADFIHGNTANDQQQPAHNRAVTYPISSRWVGIVLRARWSFFFDLMDVDSRNFVYIFRRASSPQAFPTVFPNISFT